MSTECRPRVSYEGSSQIVEAPARKVAVVPEGIEVEMYRQGAEVTVGRPIVKLHVPDEWFLKHVTGKELRRRLVGAKVNGTRRRGKLLLLDVDGPTGPAVLGLRFGMTGRLVVDGYAPIGELEYSSTRNLPAWDRFGMRFSDGGWLRLNDPRRLGGVELDPDEDRLGPDAFTATPAQLRAALATEVTLKARLLDQAVIAGIGNLLADETLWRAGLDPARSSSSLSRAEISDLHRSLRTVLRELTARGGSHCGDLHEQRHRTGVCPRDGASLLRRTVGGRTTYSCPVHQR